MTLLFPVPEPVLLPVNNGGDLSFPVRRVYCIGRNYAEHAREMGHDPDREPPFFFQKNREDLVIGGGEIAYPPATSDLHYEVELVAALSRGGSDIAPEDALSCVYGYSVGIDLTRRDRQAEAKKAGRPWEVGKAFVNSAPIGSLVPASEIGHLTSGAISLSVDGGTRQEGDLAQMIWPVNEAIACLSRLFPLAPGDLIFTGTPAGVGPVKRGQRMEARVAGLPSLSVSIL